MILPPQDSNQLPFWQRSRILYSKIFQIVSYHEAAPLLGVADAEQDDGDEDGAHADPGHHGPSELKLFRVHIPRSAIGGGAVGRHDVSVENNGGVEIQTRFARLLTIVTSVLCCVCVINPESRISPPQLLPPLKSSRQT